MTSLETLITQLKEAAAKATPGKWVTNEPACYNTYPGVYLIVGDRPNTDDEKIVINDDEATQENLEYIALCSPDNILTLCTELERLREMERDARGVIEFYGAHFYVGETDPAAVENGFPDKFYIRTPQLYEDHGAKAREFLSKWAAPVEGGK